MAVEIPVPVVVPAVVMFKPAAVTIPIAAIVTLAIMTRNNPVGAGIGWTSPITFMPHIASCGRVPIAAYPCVLRAGSRWQDRNHARRRWRTNHDGNLSECGSASQEQSGKQCCSNQTFHVGYPPSLLKRAEGNAPLIPFTSTQWNRRAPAEVARGGEKIIFLQTATFP